MKLPTKLVLSVCVVHTGLDLAMGLYIVGHSMVAVPWLAVTFLCLLGITLFFAHIRGCCW